MPVIPIAERDHGTIMHEPTKELVDLVDRALKVDDEESYKAWLDRAKVHSEQSYGRSEDFDKWQQLVVRVEDERGDPVSDWYLEFIVKRKGQWKWRKLQGVKMKVRPYSSDQSLRCFHIDLNSFDDLDEGDALGVRLVASSGTSLIAYQGFSDEEVKLLAKEEPEPAQGEWTGVIDLSSLEKAAHRYRAPAAALGGVPARYRRARSRHLQQAPPWRTHLHAH